MDYPKLKRLVMSIRSKWPYVGAILIEDTANGPAIIAELQSSVGGLIPIKTRGASKDSRLSAASAEAEANNVVLPDYFSAQYRWVNDWIDELCGFPNWPNDDRCDSYSQTMNRWRSVARMSVGRIRI